MKFILFALFYITSLSSYSQTYIKINGATSLLGIPGVGVEVPVSKKFSFQLDATMSFWNSVSIGKYSERPYVFNQIFPEVRYYTKSVNDGFYIGSHFVMECLNFLKYLQSRINISMDISICWNHYWLPVENKR